MRHCMLAAATSAPLPLCPPSLQLVRFTCPGHQDPQPQDCPGFSFPVPGTVTRQAQQAVVQPLLRSSDWLVWAQKVARRLRLFLLN